MERGAFPVETVIFSGSPDFSTDSRDCGRVAAADETSESEKSTTSRCHRKTIYPAPISKPQVRAVRPFAVQKLQSY